MNSLLKLNNICAYPYINFYLIHLAKRFKKRSKRAEQIQRGVLSELIKLNGQSDFGRAHGLAEVKSYQDLVGRLGVTDYETYRPYVEEMAGGNYRSLLGGNEKPVMFALTSGTTGKPKQIPVSRLFLRNYRRGWFLVVSSLWANHRELWSRQVFQLSSPMDDYLTASGIPCGAISGMTAKMPNKLVRSYYSVPAGATYITETSDRYYAAVRIAAEQDVGLIVTASPAALIGMAKCVQGRSEELLRDIHDGRLSEKCQIDPELRRELCRKLKPNPRLARELEQKGGAEGLRPRDYWRVSLIACWLGGTMGLYIPELRELYGDVALRDIGLMASEGRMSVPLTDNTPAGLLDIDNNFYEFIPADEMDSWSGAALLGHELEIGQKYFILLTTPSGFFRYNISDVVEVMGYEGEAPVIRFLNKGSHISSVVGEKVSAYNVVQAMDKVSKLIGGKEQCYEVVLCPQWSELPFYQLNVDAGACAGLGTEKGRAELAKAFDEALIELNIEYASKRKTNRLGAVQVRILKAGYLAECDRKQMSCSVTARSQFKHQYLLTELGADKDFPEAEEIKKSQI